MNVFRQNLEQQMYPGSTCEDYSMRDFTGFIIANMDLKKEHLEFLVQNNVEIPIYRCPNSRILEYKLIPNIDANMFKLEVYDGPIYESWVPRPVFNHILYLLEKNDVSLKYKTMEDFLHYKEKVLTDIFYV